MKFPPQKFALLYKSFYCFNFFCARNKRQWSQKMCFCLGIKPSQKKFHVSEILWFLRLNNIENAENCFVCRFYYVYTDVSMIFRMMVKLITQNALEFQYVCFVCGNLLCRCLIDFIRLLHTACIFVNSAPRT